MSLRPSMKMLVLKWVFIPLLGESKDQTYQFTVHTESQWNKRS